MFKKWVIAGLFLVLAGWPLLAEVDPEVLKAMEEFYNSKKMERQQEIKQVINEYVAEQQRKAQGPTIQDMLKAPRQQIDIEGAPVKGIPSAKITIVEFSDFECPFCSRVLPTLKDLFKEYPGQIRLVFKNNPLPIHSRAIPAAKAFLSAGEQGKYWEMHDKLFESQADLSDQNIYKIAEALKLNMDQFKKSYLSNKWDARIQAEMKQAQDAGAQGTPAFVINGVVLVGARPKAQFKELIDALLRE